MSEIQRMFELGEHCGKIALDVDDAFDQPALHTVELDGELCLVVQTPRNLAARLARALRAKDWKVWGILMKGE